MIYITIADDHKLMREGLRSILSSAGDIQVVGEASNGTEVLSHVRVGLAHVLLLDLSMPGSGTDLIRTVRASDPRLAILVLTMYDEKVFAVKTMQAGANGYLTKRQAVEELIGAVKQVASGRQYVNPEVADELAISLRVSENRLRHHGLSCRELEIFTLLVQGATLTGAASALGLSVKTVSTHKSRIFLKMQVENMAQLVQYALAHDLLHPAPLCLGE
jgi:DNA-binding NarL/FixJ family response regulator